MGAVIQDKTIRYNTQLKSISGMSIDSQMAEVARIEMLMGEEENKRSKWKQENIRRRHNYLPLIMEMLRSLASRGELLPIYNKAKEEARQESSRQSLMCFKRPKYSFVLINPICLQFR